MKFIKNSENIEGRVYQHDLVLKTVQNTTSSNYGKEYISGNLEVAVDEEGLNVIPVHFSYVTEVTNSGKKNGTFTALKKIIDEDKTWTTVGKDEAIKVKINTAIDLNEFYGQDDQLISTKRNEGGFVTIVSKINEDVTKRNTFVADMFITNITLKEANEEKNETEHMVVKGAIFNFRKELLPVEFIVRNKKGMDFLEDLDISNSNPIYTQVWGNIECKTIVTTVTKEGAFGDPMVTTYERKTKEWLITNMNERDKIYDFGAEDVLTAEEITAAMQDREKKLAEIKKRAEEYKMQKAAATSNPATTVAKSGTFSF